MPKSLAATLPLCVALTLLGGCKASEADCERLGSHFEQLYVSAQPADSPLSPKLIKNAAAAGKRQVVERCKVARPGKLAIDRCLKATTPEELREC